MQIHFPVCLAVCSANHRELRFRENPLSVVILFFLAAPSMPVAFQSVEIFPADGIGKGIFIFQESVRLWLADRLGNYLFRFTSNCMSEILVNFCETHRVVIRKVYMFFEKNYFNVYLRGGLKIIRNL